MGLLQQWDEETNNNLLPPQTTPTVPTAETTPSGGSLLNDWDIEAANKPPVVTLPSGSDLLSEYNFDLGKQMKFYFSSNPQDKLGVIQDVLKKNGKQITDARREADDIYFMVSDQQGNQKEYILNKKGLDTQDIKEFGVESIKFAPAAAAGLAAGAATGGIGAVPAFLAATAAAGATEAARSTAGEAIQRQGTRVPVGGLDEPTYTQAAIEGGATGAIGEAGGRLMFPVAKYLGAQVKNIAGIGKNYEAAFNSNNPKKIAEAISVGAEDSQLPSELRKVFKDLKQGNYEGQKIVENLTEEAAKRDYELTSEGFMKPYELGLGQKIKTQTAYPLEQKMRELASNEKVNSKIEILFANQDKAFRDKMNKLMTKLEYLDKAEDDLATRFSPGEASRVKEIIEGHIKATGSMGQKDYLGYLAESKAKDMKELSDQVFSQPINSINDTLDKINIVDVAFSKKNPLAGQPNQPEKLGAVTHDLSVEYIRGVLNKTISGMKGEKVVPQEFLQSYKINPMEAEKMAIARARAPKFSAQLSKFEQMSEQMARGRSEKQLAQPNTSVSVEDFRNMVQGNWLSTAAKWGEKGWEYIKPENRQMAANLLSSKTTDGNLLQAISKLQEKTKAEDYFQALDKLAENAIRSGIRFEFIDEVNPVTPEY